MKKNLLPLLILPALLFSCGEKKEETKKEEKSEGYDLSYKFNKDESFLVTLIWDEKITSGGEGSEATQPIQMNTTYKYVVTGLDESGRADLEIRFDHVRMNEFDSDDSSTFDGMTGQMMAPMMKMVFNTSMDSKGALGDLQGAEGFFTFGMPDSLIDDNKVTRDNLDLNFNFLPNKIVKIGDTWTMEKTISFGYPAIYKFTYTLKEVNNGVARIDVKARLTPNTAGLTIFPGGVVLKQDLAGTREGNIVFDIEKGRLIEAHYHDVISGMAKGTMNGKEMEMPIATDLKMDYTVAY